MLIPTMPEAIRGLRNRYFVKRHVMWIREVFRPFLQDFKVDGAVSGMARGIERWHRTPHELSHRTFALPHPASRRGLQSSKSVDGQVLTSGTAQACHLAQDAPPRTQNLAQ